MSTNVRNLSSVNWESGPDRKLAHNTWRETIYRQGRPVPAVRFHRTLIIIADHDPVEGIRYVLSDGHWMTSTTKQRLNALMPFGWHISQKDYVWTLHTRAGSFPWETGMIVNGDGEVLR